MFEIAELILKPSREISPIRRRAGTVIIIYNITFRVQYYNSKNASGIIATVSNIRETLKPIRANPDQRLSTVMLLSLYAYVSV